MKRWLTPISILTSFLTLLFLGASFAYAENDITLWGMQFFHLIILLGTSLGSFFALRLITPKAKLTPNHLVITSLILFLLFDPTYPWWTFVLLGIITQAGERLLRTLFGPLINPATFGLLILSLLGFSSTWWGVSFAPRFNVLGNDISIAMLPTLLVAGYVAYRYKKLSIIGAALLSFILIYTIIFNSPPIFILLEGTLLFFLLVMAVEPKTSPNLPREQYIYGAILGILIPIGIFFQIGESFLLSLVVANLYRHRDSLKKLLPSDKQKISTQ